MQVGVPLSASVGFVGCLGQGDGGQDSAPAEGGDNESTAMEANEEPTEAAPNDGDETEPPTETEEQTDITGDGGSGDQDDGSQVDGLATYKHNGDSVDLTRGKGTSPIRENLENPGETQTITDLTGTTLFGAKTEKALTGIIAVGDSRHLYNQLKVMDAGEWANKDISIVIPKEAANEVDGDPSEIPGVGVIKQGDEWNAKPDGIYQNGEQVVESATGSEVKQGVNQVSDS